MCRPGPGHRGAVMADQGGGPADAVDDRPDEPFETRVEAHRALLSVVADQRPAMAWFSADFRYWPLNDRGFIRALEIWALRDPNRPSALRMLAVDWRDVRARFPRFAAFRRDFSHVIECRVIRAALIADLPEFAWTGSRAIIAHRPAWTSGKQIVAPARLTALRNGFEPIWEQALPDFPASILGL